MYWSKIAGEILYFMKNNQNLILNKLSIKCKDKP